MPTSPENFFQFEKLLVGLARGGVDFAVVGGIAVSLNGFVRATDDVDILVDDAPENIRRMLDHLVTWGEGWARELQVDEFKAQEGSIRVMEEFDLDIFTRMKGKSFSDFRLGLRYLELEGVKIGYLGPKDLIFLKDGSGMITYCKFTCQNTVPGWPSIPLPAMTYGNAKSEPGPMYPADRAISRSEEARTSISNGILKSSASPSTNCAATR